MSLELVVFDIAGTLIEDHNEVAQAFLEALRHHQIEVTENEIEEWKGSSKRQVIEHFVQRQFGRCRNLWLVERTYNEFRFRLDQLYTSRGVAKIPGADETLDWLHHGKIKLATTTGFYREMRDRILRELGWENRFEVNVCSDDVANGRPAPDMIQLAMKRTGVWDPQKVANVGDTPLDLRAGSNARCGVIVGVLKGMHDRARLEREPHDLLLKSLAELPQWLSRS